MKNPSNRDLHILLTRIEERQINIASTVEEGKAWQKEHQTNDNKQFKELESQISGMSKYAVSIAGVSAFLGGCIGYFIDWIKKT